MMIPICLSRWNQSYFHEFENTKYMSISELYLMCFKCKDSSEGAPTIYIVFLTLFEGQFKDILQGNENYELEICLESVLTWTKLKYIQYIYVESTSSLSEMRDAELGLLIINKIIKPSKCMIN